MMEDSLFGDINEFFDKKAEENDIKSGVDTLRVNTTAKPKDVVEIFFEKLEGMGMNLNELRPILEEDDNLLAISGAGAGKSTLLILRVILDLLKGKHMKVSTVDSIYGKQQVVVPGKILVSTFLKTGADELKTKFREWCVKLGLQGVDYSYIEFKTIHAEVYDALKSMGVQIQLLEDSLPMIRQIMQSYHIRSVNATTKALGVEEVREMSAILAYARNRLDEKRYEQELMADYSMDSGMLDGVLAEFKVHRRASYKYDFEDLQEMLYEALQTNENVRNFIKNRYDIVYVDEFQDTSQLQYEVLKYYFQGAKSFMAIGDDDQTIYSWRGSDIDIILNKFIDDFSPKVMNLSVNYRCKANILNFVIPSIVKNSMRHEKELRSYAEGGQVNVIFKGSVNQMVKSIKEDLANKSSVGVIARVNADLLMPALLLELEGGIEFSLSKSVSLNTKMPRQIFGVMDLVTKRLNGDFESHLKLFVPRYYHYEVEKLVNILVTNKEYNLYNIPLEDYRYSIPNLAPTIEGLRQAKQMGDVDAYLYLLGVLELRTFVGDSNYAMKAKEMINFVREIILYHDKVKDMSLTQIDSLFNEVLPEAMSNRIKYSKEVNVKLTTVHEAKGKEWDSVYIWNVNDGIFPSRGGNRELSDATFEEERRVFYIAVTRARDKVTIYSDEAKMSPFLRECDMEVTKINIVKAYESNETKTLFKRAEPVELQRDNKGLLRSYIEEVNSQGSITDEAVANVELALSVYSVDQLADKLEEGYGTMLTSDNANVRENFEYVEQLFKDVVNEMFQKGYFSAN